jgi:hypothetical protein
LAISITFSCTVDGTGRDKLSVTFFSPRTTLVPMKAAAHHRGGDGHGHLSRQFSALFVERLQFGFLRADTFSFLAAFRALGGIATRQQFHIRAFAKVCAQDAVAGAVTAIIESATIPGHVTSPNFPS